MCFVELDKQMAIKQTRLLVFKMSSTPKLRAVSEYRLASDLIALDKDIGIHAFTKNFLYIEFKSILCRPLNIAIKSIRLEFSPFTDTS